MVGRPEIHFPKPVIPKNFKKWYLQLPCSAFRERDIVENKSASFLVVFLGETFNGMPPLNVADRWQRSWREAHCEEMSDRKSYLRSQIPPTTYQSWDLT